jgi:hypothetical protein
MPMFRRKPAFCGSIGLALFGLFVLASDAEAYIDPGIGSLGYQAALAAMLGIALVARQVWSRVVGAARSLFGSPHHERVEQKP